MGSRKLTPRVEEARPESPKLPGSSPARSLEETIPESSKVLENPPARSLEETFPESSKVLKNIQHKAHPAVEDIGSGNPFRQSDEVTYAFPRRMRVLLFLRGWLLVVGNLGLCWFLPATLVCCSL